MKRLSLHTTTILGGICGLLTAHAALAQVPGSAQPGLIQRQYQIEQTRPELGGAPLITLPEEEGKGPIKGGTQFMFNGIVLDDATVYTESELRPLYKDKIGTKITLDELNAIAAKITNHYRNNGYILTRAVIPPQRANGGMIHIRIVEGFVNDVRFVGEDVESNERLQAYAEKIRSSKPLDAKKLERYLLLMEDLPGVEARAVLQPSASTPGATDVVVNITRKPFEFLASLDNRGSRYLGPAQLGFNVWANNAFGMDEQTQARIVHTSFDPDELIFGEVRHEQQIGSEGTRLAFSASQAQTRPGYLLEPLDMRGISTAVSIGAIHPILRSRQSNWFVNGDFTARNVNVDAVSDNFYYDKTRALSLGSSYDFLDSYKGINRLDGTISQGLPMGAENISQEHSRANGESEYTKFAGRASRIQPIDGPWSAYGVVSGQYSLDPLYASEEFAIGGAEFGSAYDPAELTGDSGFAGRLELQYNQAPGEWLSQYQLYGFYDLGRVWNRDRIAGTEAAHASLSSTGLGTRFYLFDAVTGSLEGALPLTRKVNAMGEDGSAPRVFFNLQYRF